MDATGAPKTNGIIAADLAGMVGMVGYHTDHHCSCGNWSGAGSLCIYTFREALVNDVDHELDWYRFSDVEDPSTGHGVRHFVPPSCAATRLQATPIRTDGCWN